MIIECGIWVNLRMHLLSRQKTKNVERITFFRRKFVVSAWKIFDF